jgi:hypothetical protein
MAQGCVMSYGAGVRHELWRTPPFFINKNQSLIFSPSNDLTTVKKSTVRVRLRTGGKRRSRGWLPPAYGRAVGFLTGIGREAPCGPSGRFRDANFA